MIHDDGQEFLARNEAKIADMGNDKALQAATQAWMEQSIQHEYSYHFTWLGLPIIQYPQDIIAVQELIWRIQPDIVIETGVARGGSLILSASLLKLLGGNRKVIGIDIDMRPHNALAIKNHPLSDMIELIQGSSIDSEVLAQVKSIASNYKKPLVFLDSLHTHSHVLKELELYSPFVKKDSYIVVFDTLIEDMPENSYPDRPWSKGNNPKTAVREFLQHNNRFCIDNNIDNKLQITVAHNGYLMATKD